MKKVLYIFLSALLMVSGCQQSNQPQASTPSTTATPETENKRKDNIYIFYTSDVHCGVDENLTYAKMKALIDHEKEKHEFVTVVDDGDYIQGGTLGSLTKGESIITIMNAMDYDIATVGNHEFDYGMEQLGKLMDMAKFDILASNVLYTGKQKNVFEGRTKEYVIKDYAGTKVGFVGVLTPESITTSTPAFFKEDDQFVYDFYSGENGDLLVKHMQEVIDEVRAAGADYVIALTHLGSVSNNAPYDSLSFIHKTNGLDAVIDGHSHSVIVGDPIPNKDGKDVVLTSVGTKMQNLGELIIDVDGNITTMLISEYDQSDAAIEQLISEEYAKIDVILSEKLTDLSYDLSITDADGFRIVRSRETGIGNFVADAYRHVMDTEIAVVNGGGVRSAIPQGEVTFKNLFDVNPFQNTLGSCIATGQQILDALEYGAQMTQPITVLDEKAVGEYGGFLQVSGLKYTIDTSIPASIVVDENGMLKEITGERRVQDVMVLKDGQYIPLDPNATYSVASTSYILFSSGDGNTAFKGAEPIVPAGEIDVNALKQYIQDENGISDSYQQVEGRITVK